MKPQLSYLLMKICISLTLVLLGCVSTDVHGGVMVVIGILIIPLSIRRYIKFKLTGE